MRILASNLGNACARKKSRQRKQNSTEIHKQTPAIKSHFKSIQAPVRFMSYCVSVSIINRKRYGHTVESTDHVRERKKIRKKLQGCMRTNFQIKKIRFLSGIGVEVFFNV